MYRLIKPQTKTIRLSNVKWLIILFEPNELQLDSLTSTTNSAEWETSENQEMTKIFAETAPRH